MDLNRFRMQFVLGPRIPDGFDGWQQRVVGSGRYLVAHPHLNIEQATAGSVSATLVGYILDPRDPTADNTEVLSRMVTSLAGGEELFEAIHPLGGRWVLVVDDGGRARLLTDAAGMRQVFHSDVRQTTELWCASQPGHIASALGLAMDPEAVEFIEWFRARNPESWWPGDSSPYREIKRLLPNHCLELQTGRVRRFWPCNPLQTRPVDDAALEDIGGTLTGMIQSAANRFELAVGISAGWDSRLILAASRSVAKNLRYYTVKRSDMAWSHPDVHVPTKLSAKLGLPHDIIEHGKKVTPEFAEALNNCVPFAHPVWQEPLQSELNYYKRQKVGVTGNLSEVARCFYKRPVDSSRVIDADYLMSVGGVNHPFAKARFGAWLDTVGDSHGHHILDLFYWEQRAGSWLAQNCLEFDLAWQDIFIPLNNRKLMVDMLGFDENSRKGPQNKLHCRLIMKLWPEVLSEPINPVSKSRKLHKYLRSAVRRLMGLFNFQSTNAKGSRL